MKVKIGKYKTANFFRRLFNLGDPEQQVFVRIDPWDTYSMDHALAQIVLPMLEQLREQKQGSPFVEYEDVPAHLRPTLSEELKWKNKGITDNKWHERWDYAIDRMINSFRKWQDDEWENKFYTGNSSMNTVPIDKEGNILENSNDENLFGFRFEPNDDEEFQFDKEGYKKEYEEIMEGFRLFGKYYPHLWS